MIMVIWLAGVFLGSAHAQDVPWPDLSAPPEGLAEDGGRDAALIVAIENYAFLDDVDGAAQNADDWATYLEARGVPDTRIVMLVDRPNSGSPVATREAIVAKVRVAASSVKPGGTLWVVFIGHGSPSGDDEEEALLIAADATQTPAGIRANSIRRTALLSALGRAPAERSVVVLDTCFSGQGTKGQHLLPDVMPTLATKLVPSNVSIELLAAGDRQYAGELPTAGRPAFSYLMLGALRGWADGLDGERDGRVSASEALEYAKGTLGVVLTGRQQEPVLLAPDGMSDTVLATAAEPAPDLGEIRRAIDSWITRGIHGDPCTVARLESALRAAETGFRDENGELKVAALAIAQETLACLREPISAATAARVHVARAIAAAHEDQASRGIEALRAAWTVGDKKLPAWLSDHRPLADWATRAEQAGSGDETAELPTPARGYVLLDGARAKTRPEERPFVFQWLPDRDEPETTAYVLAGAPLPAFERGEQPVAGGRRKPSGKRERTPEPPTPGGGGGGKALVKVGIGIGVAGALSLASSIPIDRAAAGAYRDGSRDRADSLRVVNNAAAFGGAGAATLGGALLVVGLATK